MPGCPLHAGIFFSWLGFAKTLWVLSHCREFLWSPALLHLKNSFLIDIYIPVSYSLSVLTFTMIP